MAKLKRALHVHVSIAMLNRDQIRNSESATTEPLTENIRQLNPSSHWPKGGLRYTPIEDLA